MGVGHADLGPSGADETQCHHTAFYPEKLLEVPATF